MVLNIGQQKVSPRHLLEILNGPLERMFAEWGVPTITEKVENETGRPRARWRGEAISLPPFKLEYLTNGVMAYVERDPQVKTKARLEDIYHDQGSLERIGPDLCRRLMALGDDVSRDDLIWASKDLNLEVARVYKDNSKWRVAILQSDNFFLPMMAALGKARGQDNPEQVEDHKREILDLLREAPGERPAAVPQSRRDLPGRGAGVGAVQRRPDPPGHRLQGLAGILPARPSNPYDLSRLARGVGELKEFGEA